MFAADLRLPGLLHGRILRSPHAHARILGIDVAQALALPGVVAVVMASDILGSDRDRSLRVQVPFAEGEVLFHGQPVAAVAAESLEIADEALDCISVEYEPLPAVLDLGVAIGPDAPIARQDAPPSPAGLPANVLNRLRFQRGDLTKAFADATFIAEGTFDTAGVHQGYLEPQVVVADYDQNERLTIWSPTQGQFAQRLDIARVLGLPISRVRYVSTEVGGGFGGKSPAIVQPIAGALAMKARRPVKLVLSRSEDLAATVPSPHGQVRARIAADSDGTLTAIEARILFEAGAFASGPVVGHTMMIAASYRFPNLDVEGLEVRTNKVSGWAYRAPGGPQVGFAVEQLVDDITRQGGFDPIELRKHNAVKEGDLQPNGRPWPRIGLVESLEALKQSRLWRERGRPSSNGTVRGVGIAAGGWLGGIQPASALIRLNEDGTVQVVVGSNDISGTLTTFAVIAADVLGLPMDRVQATTADTDSGPFAGNATASKTTICVGAAVKAAAEDVRRQVLVIAAGELQSDPAALEIGEGVVRNPVTDQSITFQRIAGLSTGMGARFGPVLGRGDSAPVELAPGFSAQAVEVEVDPATGEVTITRIAAVQDVGRAINPLSVEGQLEGGVAQGLGIGLSEAMLFDDGGRLRNRSLLDYRMLTTLDLPTIESILVEVPSNSGPFGARIVGEPSILPGGAALANAVADAIGRRIYQAPLTPERVAAAARDSNHPDR